MRIVLLTLAILLAFCVLGCGGSNDSDDGSGGPREVSVLVNDVPREIYNPAIALVRITDDAYVTEKALALRPGRDVARKFPLPSNKTLRYLVVAFDDVNENGIYDYYDYEEFAAWDGTLQYDYERRTWAGYRLSSGAYLFSDVTLEVLPVRLMVFRSGDKSSSSFREELRNHQEKTRK